MNSKNSQNLPARMIPIAISVIVFFVFILVTPALLYGVEPFFSIALSKFDNEEAAKKEESKLKNSGNNAFYRKEKNPKNGDIEYQVYIEKYNSMDEAIKEAKVLKDLEIISDYLVKEVVDTPIVEEAPPETQPKETDTTQPPDNINKVPETKTGVTENKAPVPESKIIEGQAPLTAKKDAGVKAPETETTGVIKADIDIESKKVEEPLPQAKKEVEKTGIPEQDKTSGQVRREPIPVQKETPPEIKKDEAVPEKTNTPDATQTPDLKGTEPEKMPEKKIPLADVNIDQAKGATLQVGACKEEANAAILKKQLLSLGRTAFYRYETAEGMGNIYRIYITGYKTLGEAVKDAKTLVGSGVITGYARPQSKIPAADISPKKTDVTVNETDGNIYFIHTGSYKEEVNAQRAVASLKESGYKAFYVPEKEPSVIWYRVYIGDFRSEAQAREKGMELLNKGIITYFKPVAITPEEKGN
jgi:cell division septation protein DedD